MKMKSFAMILTVAVSLLLASCGSTTAVTTYTIGGTVYGLSGTGLVLQDNGGDNLSVGSSGAFIFATALASGANYSVTILTQPTNPAQTCAVSVGSGTATYNVVTVDVTCNTNSFTVGVTVSGLSGTGPLVLQDNGGSNLSVTGNGSYTFATALPRLSTYNVTVQTQPAGQTCGVMNGYGTATIANITGIQVNCVSTTSTDTIGVTVSGLSGTGLILENNDGDNLPVSANGNYNFATAIATGTTYSVTVLTQPSSPAQTCVVTVGNGTASANVTGIPVNCSNNTFNIGVTVSGLLPHTSVVLQDNGGDNLTISTNGAAANFNTPITRGASYAVTVLTQPAGATCIAGTNASGDVASANVNVAVTCGTVVSAGESHTCALNNAGDVWCWGLSQNGQLGNGTSTQSSVPVEVLNPTKTAPLSNVITIDAGLYHTCAVTSAGAVLCWGDNSQSELGNGNTANSSVPVQVTGLSSGVAAISAGSYFTCAVTTAGAAECWGEGSSGQLGNGSAANSGTPVQVSGLSSNVVSIATGQSHACALTNAGAVWCWGLNAEGQLGNGTLTQSNIPVQVYSTGTTPLSGVVAITAGQSHTCAVTTAGAALCWGDNSAGELGNGTSTNSSNPVPVSGLTSGVVAMSAGSNFTCAATNAGAAKCWGFNQYGQLGNGTATNSNTPVQVTGLTTGTAAIAAGQSHACAVINAGTLSCWGLNQYGQLGNDSTTTSPNPVEVVGAGNSGFFQIF